MSIYAPAKQSMQKLFSLLYYRFSLNCSEPKYIPSKPHKNSYNRPSAVAADAATKFAKSSKPSAQQPYRHVHFVSFALGYLLEA